MTATQRAIRAASKKVVLIQVPAKRPETNRDRCIGIRLPFEKVGNQGIYFDEMFACSGRKFCLLSIQPAKNCLAPHCLRQAKPYSIRRDIICSVDLRST